MFNYTSDIWSLIWYAIGAGAVVFLVNLLLGGIADLIHDILWGDD